MSRWSPTLPVRASMRLPLFGAVLLVLIGSWQAVSDESPASEEEPSMLLVATQWVRNRIYIEEKSSPGVDAARLDLHIDVQFGADRPVGWGRLQVQEIRDDQGRQLQLTEADSKRLGVASLPFEGHGTRPHPDGFFLRLSTGPPTATARALGRVAFSLELIYGYDRRETTLEIGIESVDRWVPLTGIEEAKARIVRVQAHRLEVQVVGVDHQVEVDVLDGSGEVVPPFSRSRMGFAGERFYRLVFRGDLPEGAKVRLRHATREERRTVRLDLSDVPLP